MPELNLESLFLLAQVDAPNQDEAIQTFGIRTIGSDRGNSGWGGLPRVRYLLITNGR